MEKLSGVVWQKMDADHGDLADVVRRSAVRCWRETPRGAQRTVDASTFPPQEISSNFGDPFFQPLLPELGGQTFFDCDVIGPDPGREEDLRAVQIPFNKKSPTAPIASSSLSMLSGDIGSSLLHHGEFQISHTEALDMKRKNQMKKVVCIPAPAASSSKQVGDIIPPDLWAWRKYGQKPIKGSPYPRGYYKCSSSKGCSARKQVERSRSDPSMLVITYTSEHNHPWPTQKNTLAGSTRSMLARSGNSAINGGFSFNKDSVLASEGFFNDIRELEFAGEERRARTTFWGTNWGL